MNGDEHEHGREENFIKNTRQISLEKYSTLLSSSADLSTFTLRQLNTILSIHGTKQMNGKKEQLVDAVRKLELKDLARCTLGEDIHPAPMSQANVVRDLALLNWQACPVVSVRSVTSPHCTTKSNVVVARDPIKAGNKKSRDKMKELSGLVVGEPKSPSKNSGSSSNQNSGSKRKRKANPEGTGVSV